MSRRAMLRDVSMRIRLPGTQSLLAETADGLPAADPLAPKPPHFPARAKRVIFLFMHGGPSSIDTFDPKPYLDAQQRKAAAYQAAPGIRGRQGRPLMKSPWTFRPGGQSGLPVSDLFRNVRECADDLCVIRSMVGEGVDHGAALLQTFTGTFTFARPAWVPGCSMAGTRIAICLAISR